MSSLSTSDSLKLPMDCIEDLNDSSHSTIRADIGSLKDPVPNCCLWSSVEPFPAEEVVALHQQYHIPFRYVHFSKVVQVLEVPHRKDMSLLELNARWDIDPEISRSIFDDNTEVLPRAEENEEKRRRRRKACLIRRQVLADYSIGGGGKDDAAALARKYTQYSAHSVQEAHVAALKLAHDIDEDSNTFPSQTEGLPSLPRKRLLVTQPLAAVKRLRLS